MSSTAASRRRALMPHEDRQALIRLPYPITYYPPQKRWGGVQIINDEDWMRDANAWRKRYASADADESMNGFAQDAYNAYQGSV